MDWELDEEDLESADKGYDEDDAEVEADHNVEAPMPLLRFQAKINLSPELLARFTRPRLPELPEPDAKRVRVDLQLDLQQASFDQVLQVAPAPCPLELPPALPSQADYDRVNCSLELLRFVPLGGSGCSIQSR
jgi:hypothetical protein